MKDIKELLNFGLINIDKPAGPTSFSVSEFVRKSLGISKTSHMGTLDPKVTGVLPITLGRACKLAGYFIKHDKTYVGILETHQVCDIVELQNLIDENFVGKIRQTPPHRSAVARVERKREVYYWKLLEVGSALPEKLDSSNRKSSPSAENLSSTGDLADKDNLGKYFLFECKVEGGTYIRKLCSDLGEMIGGGHMGELRRISAGIFDEAPVGSNKLVVGSGRLVSLYEFEKAVQKAKLSEVSGVRYQVLGDDKLLRGMIVPAEDAIRQVLPVVEVDKSALRSLYTGKPLLRSNVVLGEVKKGEKFAAFCEGTPSGHENLRAGVFVGVYTRSETSRENRKLEIENRDNEIFGRAEFVKN